MHPQIDDLVYHNQLRSLPPAHKLTFAGILFVLGYLSPSFLQVIITLWLMIWIIFYAKIPYQTYLQLQGIVISFWLISLPALILNITVSDSLNHLNPDSLQGITLGHFYLYLSHKGIEQGISLLTRAIALTSTLYFILLTTPLTDILPLLKKIGFPSLLLELISLMYRFIFLLTDTVSELLNAQNSRLGYRNWQTSLRSLSLVITQLLGRTLENYRQISLGLTSRGFQGELTFFSSFPHRPNLRYTLEAIIGCLLLIIANSKMVILPVTS